MGAWVGIAALLLGAAGGMAFGRSGMDAPAPGTSACSEVMDSANELVTVMGLMTDMAKEYDDLIDLAKAATAQQDAELFVLVGRRRVVLGMRLDDHLARVRRIEARLPGAPHTCPGS